MIHMLTSFPNLHNVFINFYLVQETDFPTNQVTPQKVYAKQLFYFNIKWHQRCFSIILKIFLDVNIFQHVQQKN